MNYLDIYLKTLEEWLEYLTTSIDDSRWLFIDKPKPLPIEVVRAIKDTSGPLYDDVETQMGSNPEAWLRSRLKRKFKAYYALSSIKKLDEGAEAIGVLLAVGRVFLQNVSELAFDLGCGVDIIEQCTGMRPRGVGVVTTAGDTIQGCQAGNNIARSGDDGAVCNSDISHMENPSKKGRPVISFKDLMIDDDDGSKLRKVHILMNGKKGKRAALVILSCVLKGWMTMPKFKQVQVEFGCVGVRQGFTKYLNKESFTDVEIEGAMRNLILSE